MNTYFTVIILPRPVHDPANTGWHAPDATLQRGAFSTPGEARDWANVKLGPKYLGKWSRSLNWLVKAVA